MAFTVSVVYRVLAADEHCVTLEVGGLVDPAAQRPDLAPGTRLTLKLHDPAPIFRNEVHAFLSRGVAAVNIPGVGCDIAGYVSAGESAAEAYLLAGDFVGAEADLQHADVRMFEVATTLLSALLTKAHFQGRADRDRLTGLLSSARIRTELEASLRRSAASGRPLTLVLADVDHFKRINDQHGHLQGDAVLAELGRLLPAALRSGQDHAGRYGGEEFLLILDAIPPDEARLLVERLRNAVEQHPFPRVGTDGAPLAQARLAVTLSFGAAHLAPGHPPLSANEAIALADRALYAAKQAGRNRVEEWKSCR